MVYFVKKFFNRFYSDLAKEKLMGSSPITLELNQAEVAAPRKAPLSTQQPSPISLFKTIPPERIGLNGEYDHSGLAKRVMLSVRRQFALADIKHLSIAQRGCVVVLRGQVPQRIMTKLIQIACNTYGATDVETNAVSFIE